MEIEKNRGKEKYETQENQDTSAKNVDFDDILPHAGEFGLYQLFLFISTMPFYFFGSFIYFGQLFMTEAPNHWCWIPELENFTIDERKSLAIPYYETGKTGYAKCIAYAANWSEVLKSGIKPNNTWSTQTCQNGWEYNLTEIPYQTISTEMNWVCDQDSNQASAQSIFFIGSLIGCILFGVIADKFGRLPAVVSSCLIGCLGGVASIFAKNFAQFSVCRFFTGLAFDSCMMIVYLLVLEYTAPRYRTLLSNLSFGLFFSIACVALPFIALACDHWKIFTLATSVPLALAIVVPFIMPESPRWLLSKRRLDDAIQKLLIISRINKKIIPSDVIKEFKSSYHRKSSEKTENITIEILKRPLLRKMILLICLEYFCCNLIFDTLVRSIGVLDFDFFISFAVISATECPSLFIVAFVMDWMGKRWLTTISLFLCSVFSFGTYFVNSGIASVLCIIFARFFVNMAYNACFQWAAEMLPTPVRGTYVSIIHTIGYLAIMISPFIVYLDTYFSGLPFIVVTLVAIVGGICALCLPETTNKDMPQSVDDAENLVLTQKFWELPCKKVNTSNKDVSGKDNHSYEQ